MKIHIGANFDQFIYISKVDVRKSSTGLSSIDVVNMVELAIMGFDNAINIVSSYHSELGAFQYRLIVSMNSAENVIATGSCICDSDIAKEIMNHTKNFILSQAAQAMLA